MRKYLSWLLSFVSGALLLCIFLTLEKLGFGVPLSWKGYLVPFLFGGCAGLLLKMRHRQLKQARDELQSAQNNLEIRVKERTLGLEQRILERMLAEEKLQKSEEDLRTTLNSIGDAVIATDTGGRIVHMNPVAESLTGWNADDGVGKPLTEVFNRVDGNTGEQGEDPVEEVIKKAQTVRHVNHGKLIAKDGKEYRIVESGAPLKDDKDRLKGAVLSFRHMPEDDDKWEVLRKREENQRILLDHMRTQVWYMTNEHTYGVVNGAHAAFNGLKKEDLAFKNLYDLYPKQVAEVWCRGNIHVFKTGEPVYTEEWLPHASGEERLISIAKRPKFREDETVEYIVCSAEDITERRQTDVLDTRAMKRWRGRDTAWEDAERLYGVLDHYASAARVEPLPVPAYRNAAKIAWLLFETPTRRPPDLHRLYVDVATCLETLDKADAKTRRSCAGELEELVRRLEKRLAALKSVTPSGNLVSAQEIARSLNKRFTKGESPYQGPRVPLMIQFDVGKADMRPEAKPQLKELAEALKNNELRRQKIIIEGHTDSQGGMEYNQGLSDRRARSVKHYLVQNFSLPESRFIIKGCGETRPLKPNDSPGHRAMNCRVEFVNSSELNRFRNEIRARKRTGDADPNDVLY